MKKIDHKLKVLAIIVLVTVVAGIIVIATKGFNFDLRYEQSKRIELDIGKEFEISDIKSIVDEIKPNEEILIQKVEVFEDCVSITAKEITEEEKTTITNKVNEKYGTELSIENIEIQDIPHTRLLDIIKPYIMPLIISTFIILVYLSIRYRNLKISKVISKSLISIIISQAVLVSIIAIARIPIVKIAVLMVLSIYILNMIAITSKFEKEKLKLEETE